MPSTEQLIERRVSAVAEALKEQNKTLHTIAHELRRVADAVAPVQSDRDGTDDGPNPYYQAPGIHIH